MLTLDIAIPTNQPEGIKRIEKLLLPPIDDIRYVVSWQEHGNAPIPESITSRNDVIVYRLEQKGLSANRNNAINHCNGDIVLIGDDDIIYNDNSLKKIVAIYENSPDIELALFKMKYPHKKKYPLDGSPITIPLPKGYYGSAVEISFRRSKIGNLQFWRGLGLGNDYLSVGEDEFFLISAIKRGLKAKFFDLDLGIHPSLSTGGKVSDGILRGQGFLISVIYPWTAVLRIPLKAYRLKRDKNAPLLNSLLQLGKGGLHAILKLRTIPKACKW